MAPWNSAARLVWNGSSSIPQIIGNLQRGQRTVLRLPAAYHPAFSERLYGDVRIRKRIDRVGGAKLLADIAEIEGLHDLIVLVRPMHTTGARLRVRSPAPHLVFNARAARPRIARPGRPRKLQLGEPWNSRAAPVECDSCGTIHASVTSSPQY